MIRIVMAFFRNILFFAFSYSIEYSVENSMENFIFQLFKIEYWEAGAESLIRAFNHREITGIPDIYLTVISEHRVVSLLKKAEQNYIVAVYFK